jgi:beta-lactamase class D
MEVVQSIQERVHQQTISLEDLSPKEKNQCQIRISNKEGVSLEETTDCSVGMAPASTFDSLVDLEYFPLSLAW